MPKTEFKDLPIEFVEQFINAGSLFDERERRSSCETLLEREQIDSLEKITELSRRIRGIFKENANDLLLHQNKVQEIEQQTKIQTNAASIENQPALFTELTVADQALENAEIESFNRANCYQEVLSYGLTLIDGQDDQPFIVNQLIYDVFFNLNPGLICLVQRLLQAKLHEHDYYDCFRRILRKGEFITQYGQTYIDTCIELFTKDVSKDRKIDAQNPTVNDIIHFIISCRHLIYLLQQHQQTAKTTPIAALIDRATQVLHNFGVQFSITETEHPELDVNWQPAFQIVERVYHNLQNQDNLASTVSSALDDELFNSLSSLNSKNALDGSDAVQFNLLVQHFMTRLKIYTEFKDACFSPRVLSLIDEIASKIEATYLRQPQLCEGYFHHAFVSLFKRVTQLLAKRQQALSTTEVNKISAAMAVLDLAEATPSASASSSSTTSVLVDAPTEPWLMQLARLEPILAAMKSSHERAEANDDHNAAILASLTKYLETSTKAPKNLSEELDELIGVLQNYVQCKTSALPVSTIERVYRTTLGYYGELLKVKEKLNQSQQQSVYSVLDPITRILADDLRQSKALQIKRSELSATQPSIDLGRIKQEYLELSNNADRAVRHPLMCAFFDRNKAALTKNCNQFVQEVIASYGLVSYALDKNRAIITQLIAHNVRLNAFEGLLAFSALHATSETNTLLKTAFLKDLLGTTYLFYNNFATNQIEGPFYFFAYLMMIEKTEWLNQFYDDWWKMLLEQRFGSEEPLLLQQNIGFLCDLFHVAPYVCWKYDQREMANRITQQGLLFCETAMPIVAEHRGLVIALGKLKANLDQYRPPHAQQPEKAWLVVFNTLIRHFRELACEVPLQKTAERPTLFREAQALKIKIDARKKIVDQPTLNSWLTDLLTVCKSFKAIDNEALASDYQLLLSMVRTLARLSVQNPRVVLKKGATKEVQKDIKKEFEITIRATNSAFAALTNDLNELMAKKSAKPVVDNAPSEETQSTSASSHTTPTIPVEAITTNEDHQAQLALERKRHQETTQEMQAQAKIQHKEKLDEQAQQQQAKLSALQAKHAQKQQSLAQTLARQLEDKQEKLADQHRRAKALAAQKHEDALAELKRQHQLAIQAAVNEHNQAMALVTQHQDIELAELIAKQSQELQALKRQQHLQVTEAKQKAKQALETDHQQAISTNKEIHQYALVALSQKRRAIEGHRPIARAVLPQQLKAMLLDFERHDIEAYVYGGWPRDFLLSSKHGPYSDYNIIVRAKPERVKEVLKSRLMQDPFDAKQLLCHRIVIRCNEWASLQHEPCDFTVNSFICTAYGYIFDLRNNARDLGSRWLIASTDLDAAFQEHPSLMLRMLQLSVQLNKRIDERDFAILLKHKTAITNIDIQLYLDHIRALFINPQSKIHLKGIMASGLVNDIFPGLSIFGNCLEAFPLLNGFIEERLSRLSQSKAFYGGEQVLALFILISMLFNVTDEYPLAQQCAIATHHFFAAYRHPVSESDRLRITQVIHRIMLDSLDEKNQTKLGLYSQCMEFQNKLYAEQFYVPQATPQLVAFDRAREKEPAALAPKSSDTHLQTKQKRLR